MKPRLAMAKAYHQAIQAKQWECFLLYGRVNPQARRHMGPSHRRKKKFLRLQNTIKRLRNVLVVLLGALEGFCRLFAVRLEMVICLTRSGLLFLSLSKLGTVNRIVVIATLN